MWYRRCSNCGIYEGKYLLWNYDRYCEDCAARLVVQCDYCGRLYDRYEVKMHEVGRNIVCDFCYEPEEEYEDDEEELEEGEEV